MPEHPAIDEVLGASVRSICALRGNRPELCRSSTEPPPVVNAGARDGTWGGRSCQRTIHQTQSTDRILLTTVRTVGHLDQIGVLDGVVTGRPVRW